MARRYTTLMLASRLQREIDQLFHEIGQAAEALDAGDWQPAIDVFENETSVCVLVELPGVGAGDVQLSVEGNLLTLRGRKQPSQTHPPKARFQRVETGHGSFERRLRIDAPVNSHQASAELRQGLLTVVLPKVADRRSESRDLAIREA
jgi:HSP20 family protein